MNSRQIIVVSSLVDATIREYQTDVDFRLFKNLNELGTYVETQALRASILFFTKEILHGVNTSFSYLADLVVNNHFLNVDEVVFITEKDSPEIDSLKYLIDDQKLENWKIVEGNLTRAYVTEVINGTYREDVMSLKRKGVYRVPRNDYIKQQLRNKDSLIEEQYEDDDNYLAGIPDEESDIRELPQIVPILKRVYIAGIPSLERTAFAFLCAQYLSLTKRTIIVESDNNYHTLSEISTKSGVDALRIDMTNLINDTQTQLDAIRKSNKNLVIVEAIDRVPFNYRFIMSLLFYNLIGDFDYIINEVEIDEVPQRTNCVVTIPNTMLGILQTGELIDISFIPYISFAGINLNYLPELHINSGKAMSKILSDILSSQNISCPVITISTLTLNNGTYDIGSIIGKGAFE